MGSDLEEKDEELKEVRDSLDDKSQDECKDVRSPIPLVGMTFNTDMDAYYFYNKYAKNVGFSVRKKTMYSNAKGIVKRRDLCCSWEGSYQMKAPPKKKREEKRCGCKAHLIVKLSKNEKYVVTSFVEEHNHPLENPKNAHKLRSHRQLDPSQMASQSELSKEVQNLLDDDAEDECVNLRCRIPVVGMLFNSDMDAYHFYCRYAKRVGFSVRKKTMYYSANGKVKRRDLCCSSEGSYQKKSTPKRKREERRCGCEAMLIVRLNEDDKYVVTNFVEEHNHPLENPENAHKLRCHRQAEPSEVGVLTDMDVTNLVYCSEGELNQTDLDVSYLKRYDELSRWAETLVAKGAKTDEKFALTLSDMLHAISKLDSLPDSVEHVTTFHDNNPISHEVPIDQGNSNLLDADFSLQDQIQKNCPGRSKTYTIKELEKRRKKWKDITSKQAESVIGSSKRIQEKDQILEAEPNTNNATKTESPVVVQPSHVTYSNSTINQSDVFQPFTELECTLQCFRCNQFIPIGKPSVPCDQKLDPSQGLAKPLLYTTEKHTTSTPCSQILGMRGE